MLATTKAQEIRELATELGYVCDEIVSHIDNGTYQQAHAFRDYNRIRYEYMVVLLDKLMDYDRQGE